MTTNIPCPFCGGKEIGALDNLNKYHQHCWIAYCIVCKTQTSDYYATEQAALDFWNTRTSVENTVLQAQIDALVIERDAWQKQAHYYANLSLQTCRKLDALDSTWYSSADELTDIGLTYRELNAALQEEYI